MSTTDSVHLSIGGEGLRVEPSEGPHDISHALWMLNVVVPALVVYIEINVMAVLLT
jgi:hypothetical protein